MDHLYKAYKPRPYLFLTNASNIGAIYDIMTEPMEMFEMLGMIHCSLYGVLGPRANRKDQERRPLIEAALGQFVIAKIGFEQWQRIGLAGRMGEIYPLVERWNPIFRLRRMLRITRGLLYVKAGLQSDLEAAPVHRLLPETGTGANTRVRVAKWLLWKFDAIEGAPEPEFPIAWNPYHAVLTNYLHNLVPPSGRLESRLSNIRTHLNTMLGDEVKIGIIFKFLVRVHSWHHIISHVFAHKHPTVTLPPFFQPPDVSAHNFIRFPDLWKPGWKIPNPFHPEREFADDPEDDLEDDEEMDHQPTTLNAELHKVRLGRGDRVAAQDWQLRGQERAAEAFAIYDPKAVAAAQPKINKIVKDITISSLKLARVQAYYEKKKKGLPMSVLPSSAVLQTSFVQNDPARIISPDVMMKRMAAKGLHYSLEVIQDIMARIDDDDNLEAKLEAYLHDHPGPSHKRRRSAASDAAMELEDNYLPGPPEAPRPTQVDTSVFGRTSRPAMKTQANVKLAADIKEGTQRMAAERLRKKARAGTPVPETMDDFPAPGTDLALQEHPQPISKTASFLTSITALPNPLPRQAPTSP
ncbi:hypothetical protein CALCODRAFT_488992 [Calocera cornea HHB12733]|uniref:Uncharacterized protein n=1 Tax=Calocera cornea HHB12733 TaxID=1353952 RepID=A0A165C0G1_9BASI|nr:hypothetical protein CALCODRAFT_488992 [Calocera cornea HHB12733]